MLRTNFSPELTLKRTEIISNMEHVPKDVIPTRGTTFSWKTNKE